MLGRWRRRPPMVVTQVVSRQPPMMPCSHMCNTQDTVSAHGGMQQSRCLTEDRAQVAGLLVSPESSPTQPSETALCSKFCSGHDGNEHLPGLKHAITRYHAVQTLSICTLIHMSSPGWLRLESVSQLHGLPQGHTQVGTT
jgi:hypothetical protein